ncbi:ATP-binding protein Uup [Buchnera aphidicola (Eriosoma grossulariae)]|uniref:ATP-binding cassette domain-containing protein n=1 Tax=Buchnera aphidicola TaxID=9 RepID=UPI0034645824
MSIINLQNSFLSFHKLIILNNVNLQINNNERICLIGKNGAGKSTLLKVLAKKQELDQGKITYKNGIKISYLSQNTPVVLEQNIDDFIFNQKYCIKKQSKKSCLIQNNNIKNINISHMIKNQFNQSNQQSKINQIIHSLNIKKHDKLSNLSGGELQKTMLAKAIINDADLLLLDEPTNHLDLKTIIWLENFFIKFSGSILFISHDRAFIQKICTKIINLDRGDLIVFPGNYNQFNQKKEKKNEIELIKNEKLKKKIEQENKWFKKNTKARCTRNEGRVKILKKNQNIFNNLIKMPKKVNIDINYQENYQKIICKIRNITFNIQKKSILKIFSETIIKGDKIALIGNNGSGKSTMLKLILKNINPTTGKITLNKNLNIAYFDQNHSTLNLNQNILENLSYGKQEIVINKKKESITHYLQKFLFSEDQITRPIQTLSGGEKSRLLLAKIFLIPSNVLILDEPTNNLDIETLKILENAIINYTGTVLLVSHDRTFINNTVKKCWYFTNTGQIHNYIGGYKNIPKKLYIKNINQKKPEKLKKNINNTNITNKKINNPKLSYHLQKELYNLPSMIEKIEKNIFYIQQNMKQKSFFTQNQQEIKLKTKELKKKEKELNNAFNRWNELEQLKNYFNKK